MSGGRSFSADRSETETPLRSKKPWRLFLWERRWTDAEETKASMLLSRMPEADRQEVL